MLSTNWFLNVNPTSNSWKKIHLVMMHYWIYKLIRFVNTSLSIFEFILMRDIGLWLSFHFSPWKCPSEFGSVSFYFLKLFVWNWYSMFFPLRNLMEFTDTSHQSLKFLCGNILITGSTALMGVRLFGYSLLVPAVLVCVFWGICIFTFQLSQICHHKIILNCVSHWILCFLKITSKPSGLK